MKQFNKHCNQKKTTCKPIKSLYEVEFFLRNICSIKNCYSIANKMNYFLCKK